MLPNTAPKICPVHSNSSSQSSSLEENPQLNQLISRTVLGLLSDPQVLSGIKRLQPFPINQLPVPLHGLVLLHLSYSELFTYIQVSKKSRKVIFHKFNKLLLKRVLLHMIALKMKKTSLKVLKSLKQHESLKQFLPNLSFTRDPFKYDFINKCFVRGETPSHPFVSEVTRTCKEVIFPLMQSGNFKDAKKKLDELNKHRAPLDELLPEDELTINEHLDGAYEKLSLALLAKGEIKEAKETLKEIKTLSVKDSAYKSIVTSEIKCHDFEAAMSTIALFVSEDRRIDCYKELSESIGYNHVEAPIFPFAAV